MRDLYIYIPFSKTSFGSKLCSYVCSSNEKGLPCTINGINSVMRNNCKEDWRVRKCKGRVKAWDIYIGSDLVCRVEKTDIDETNFPDVPNIKQIKNGK